MIDLLRWEWFKLRSRRIIWALFAVLVGFASLVVFIRFVDYQIQKDRPVIGEVVFRPGTPVVAGLEVDLDCDQFQETGALPDDIPEPFTADDVDFDRTGAECRKERADIGGRIDRLVGS